MEACTHIAEKVMHTIKAILAFNIPDTSQIAIKRNDVFYKISLGFEAERFMICVNMFAQTTVRHIQYAGWIQQ